MIAWRIVIAFIAALAPGPLLADASFFLDVDPGGHRAFVKDLAFTADGQFLLSASDDKTVRVWDVSTGATVRTLRGQVGPGHEGKIFALAVSPDSRTVAVGGYFGPGFGESPPYGDVRLFDLRSGRLTAVLKAYEYVLYALAFSPDGTMLAAGGQDGYVDLWRRDGSGPDAWTRSTRLDADARHLTKLAFLAGGTRLAAATDYGFRLWNLPAGEEIVLPGAAETWRDHSIRALAASEDGKTFAIGNEAGRVALWSAEDGRLVGELPQREFSVGSLQFAGDRLVVSCGYRCADRNRTEVWTLGGQQPLFEHRGHDGSVFAGAVSPDATTVATAGGTNHAIRLWDSATGEERKVLGGTGAPVMAVGLEPRTPSIAWGAQNPCPELVACPDRQGRLEASLKLPTADRFLEPPERLSEGGGFTRAVHAAGAWQLRAEEGGDEGLANATLAILRDGQPAAKIVNDATTGYLHAAFTFLGGGSRLVTAGNDGTIMEYASDGARLLGEFRGGHTGEVHAIAASEDINLLLTGSADQTLGLWNLKTRELIVSMFFAGEEWVIWTPQGYYFSSDEGDKLIGWHVNQAPDREARFVRAAQLKRHLWSPELVRRAIVLQSARAAAKEMRPGVDRELERLLGRQAPEFDVRVAENQSGVAEGFVALEILAEPGAGGEGTELSILSGNRHVGAGAATRAAGQGRQIVEVPVEPGENRISVTVTDSFGYMTERGVVAIGKKHEQKKRGKLYVAVIGVEDYPLLPEACAGRSCDLRYPVDDATEFLHVLASRSAPMFSGLETLVLVNREALADTPDRERALGAVAGLHGLLEPEADAITDELADFLDRPGPDDTTFVFVAGHGVNVDEDYYFVPTDGRMSEPGRWRRSSLVDWGDIQKAVERAKGTRVMLLDTCHAQNSFNPRLEKDAADARIVVFSATAANSTAAELPELGHGVFTYSILQGLRGKAARGTDGVRLLDLASYLSREMTRLTQDRQKPFFYISNMDDILLAGPF